MNNFGYTRHGNFVCTYQIGETALSEERTSGKNNTDLPLILGPLGIAGYQVWPNGQNNLDPNICDEMISSNRLLPELIEKQCKILYGRGPMLYIDSVDEDGNVQRKYVQSPQISAWLDSWRERGLPDSFPIYINKAIRSYYYSEGIFSKWHLTKSVKAGLKGMLPVAGLEHLSEIRCRFATDKNITGRTDIEDRDFNYVMVGNWQTGSQQEYKVYPRIDYLRPLGKHCSISYSKNPTHGNEVYASNVFFKGIKEWIRGCNATPEYINSYLENALSARLHIIIPNQWMLNHKEALSELCDQNSRREAAGQELITITVGSKKMDVGTVYSDNLLQQYLKLELQNLTEFLSGRGKNQGKVYATRGFINQNGQTEEWKIEEIPQKYKEFIESLITYDKRADMVLLSSKGIDSSISNVSSDGIISKSGSDAYYNYMIYLTQQAIPEEIVCADVNYAIKLNFPDEYARGVRIGFYRPTVQRQEEQTPNQRMSNQKEV